MSWAKSAMVAPALIAAILLGGCGGPEVSAHAKCDGPAFTSDDMPTAAPQTLVLVELSRNSQEARETVIQAIDPTVTRAVGEGGVIRLLASGGEGQAISESACLNGAAAIMVDRNNDETQRNAQDTAVSAIEGDVADQLEGIKIAPRGDLSNLLATAPDELRSLATASGTGPGAPVSVLVVSDLTGPASPGNCLNLDGVQASQRVADALVARCLETHQLRRLPPGVALRIVRPQLTPGNSATATMSTFVDKSLCAQLTEGGGCAPGSAGRG
jgi:hypothetical protein